MRAAWPRCSQRPNAQPRPSAQAIASRMAHQKPATRAVTCGVKYRPRAVPITHCAALRSGGELRVGAPSTEASEVASSGPIIQGSGVRSRRTAAPRRGPAPAWRRRAGTAAGHG